MKKLTEAFYAVLKSRNDKQIEAITTTEGPVLVVAGPGTGKTDVLSLRAGYIIDTTDSAPQNILCLTFTEAGTVAMRRRLLKYIGPEAYNIGIFTFHGFCNMVIQEHIEIFGGYRELQLQSDLELIKTLKKIIDGLALDHPLKRLTGDIYFEARRLQDLFSVMKQENWTVERLIAEIDYSLEHQKLEDKFRYKRKYKEFAKGDLNPTKWAVYEKSLEKTRAAAQLINVYNKTLARQKRFDYQDMILWVIKGFQEHPDVLADYQERYQYIMVDEFQDSNGSQMAIVDLLANYWDRPNLFVVGDDDQSIYRFQGANMENIQIFSDKYTPAPIILENNYRSSQNILDSSKKLIQYNVHSPIKQMGMIKSLIAASDHKDLDVPVSVEVYPNQVQEEAALVQKLVQLYEEGAITDNEKVGVIYRNHSQASRIIRVLEALKIPIEIKRKYNILLDPFGRNLITILRYLAAEINAPYKGDYLLFEIMHYRFFNIDRHDIVKIQLQHRAEYYKEDTEQSHIYDLLFNDEFLESAHLTNKESIYTFRQILKEWKEHYYEYTVQVFFEYLLTSGGIMSCILESPKRNWYLQVINTIMDFIKNESAKNYKFSLNDFIDYLDDMQDHNISLSIQKSMQSEVGIQFMTAHGAKGLQFDHVFIFDASQKKWDNPRGQNRSYKLPHRLIPIQADGSIEDDRRLFYVAMTRARTHLHISYATSDGEKDRMPSVFVEELYDANTVDQRNITTPEEIVVQFLTQPLMKQSDPRNKFDPSLIKDIIDGYKLNATGLNKYLKCPVSFYFENILRVPSARNASMGFGNAIHFALEQLFTHKTFDDLPALIQYYEIGMSRYRSHFTDKEFEERTHYGHTVLTAYFNAYSASWNPGRTYKSEHPISTQHRNIPINGKLDLVEVIGDRAYITDFKTGTYVANKLSAPKKDDDIGSDYWRQIMFYKILIMSDPKIRWAMDKGYMDFVQPDNSNKLHRKEITLIPEHIKIVSDQIVDTYTKIKNYEFEQGCGEEDCYWCSLE